MNSPGPSRGAREKILPVKGNSRKSVRSPAARWSRRARVVVTLCGVAMAAQLPAYALNEPRLQSTFPRENGSLKAQAATLLTATYDRNLSAPPASTFSLVDPNNNPVPGFVSLSGTDAEPNDKHTITFRPDVPLFESPSDYTATIVAAPLVPGDPTTSTLHFRIDDTAPAIPAITDPIDGQVRRDQPIVVEGTAEPGASAVIVENEITIARDVVNQAGRYAVQLPYEPEDGVWRTVVVYAIDEAGNAGGPSASVSFYHDSVVVNPIITAPKEGANLNSTSVTVRGTAKPDTTVSLFEGPSLGSVTTDHAGHWSMSLSASEGPHAVTAYSFDGVTVDGPSNARAFVVDLTAPAVPAITTPAPGAQLPSHDVLVSGTAEPRAEVRVKEGANQRANIAADGSGAWSGTISFSEGPHTITATAIDAAGNAGPASAARAFTVDTVAPVAPVILVPSAGAFINTGTVTITGRAEASTTVRVDEGLTPIGTTVAALNGAWSIALPFSEGLHAVRATAIDGAGNTSPASDARAFHVDLTPPGTPVIASPPEGSGFIDRAIFIAGTAEAMTQVTVMEGTTTIGSAPADHNGNWSFTKTLANGTHTITATATDLAGNASAATGPRTFTVGSTTDTTPPPAPVITEPAQGSLNPGTVVIKGTAEPESTVRVYEVAELLGSATANANGSWVVGAFLKAGTHAVRATATDRSNNLGPPSTERGFRVDTARPTITMDGAGPHVFLPLDAVTLEGGAADDYGVARVELEYEDAITGKQVLAETAQDCAGCPNAPVRWKATPGLSPGVYTVRAFAVDLVGNRSDKPASTTIIVI